MDEHKQHLDKQLDKQLGQFFTVSELLQNTVCKFVKNKPNLILEPSVGAGHLQLAYFKVDPKCKFDTYEIDGTIAFMEGVTPVICDFLTTVVEKKYKTIIGNPPFIKTKTGNTYIKFINKCFKLLDNGGELVMIVPSDVFKLTSAAKMLNEMTEVGSFTDVFHPNKENLFPGANVDVLVFRYQIGIAGEAVMFNGVVNRMINIKGTITFSDDDEKKEEIKTVSDIFNVYVGLVNGKEAVYKSPLGNIEVMNKKGISDKYISVTFPSGNVLVDAHLLKHKDALISRKIKKFGEHNWYEWGAPRNIKIMKDNIGKPCIYIYTLTRDKEIAWVDVVKYYGGSILMLLPKNDMTNADLNTFITMFNSDKFRSTYIQSGRFKIGHRQISNSII